MAIWAHADVLDNGPNYIKDNCNSQVAVIAYTAGDTYATVTGGANVLATVAMASGDFTNATAGSDRTLTTAAGKQDAAADASGVVSHLVFLDTVGSKVLWATEETSGQSITVDNPVSFPSLVYTAKQPIAAV